MLTKKINDRTKLLAHFVSSNVDHVPAIKSTRSIVKEGDQMTLDCSINVLKGETYTINWKWPNKNAALTVK